MDFMSDQTLGGTKLRVLTMVDAPTRLSPAIDVHTTYRGIDVVGTLERVIAIYGLPTASAPTRARSSRRRTSTSGPGRTALSKTSAGPGESTDKAFAEPFNSRVRAELLSANWILTPTGPEPGRRPRQM